LNNFKTIDGNAFFPLKRWPEEMRLMFWRKPIGVKNPFRLMSKYYVLAIPQFNLPIRYNRLLSATNIPFTTNVKEHNFKKLVPTK